MSFLRRTLIMWNQPMLRIHHNEGTGAMRRSTSMWLTQAGTVMFSVPPLRRSTMSKAKEPAKIILGRKGARGRGDRENE